MGKAALIATVVVLIQAFANAQVQIQKTTTYHFKIDHALDMMSSSDAQRDALLQQVLSFWKTILAQYNPTKVQIKFLQQADSMSPGHHIIQYRISGDSATEVRLQDVTNAFESSLSTSGISGVATLASLQGGSDAGLGQNSAMVPGGTMSWTIDLNLILSGTANTDQIAQQILSLWQQTFATSGMTNVKITTTTNRPNGSGGKSIVYRLQGDSQGNIDVGSLLTQFVSALQNANIMGVDVTPLINQVNQGGSSGQMDIAGGMTGGQNSPMIDVPTNGGMSGGMTGGQSGSMNIKPFTVNNQQITITASSDAQLQQQLNQILALWKTTLSQYQISNLKIKIVSKKPVTTNGQKGFQVVYVISGQSQQNVPTNTVTTRFQTTFQNANLNGFSLVPSGGSTTTNNNMHQSQQMNDAGMNQNQNMNMNGGGMSQSQNMGGAGMMINNNQNIASRGLTTWNVDIQLILSGQANANSISQQILKLWQTTFAQNQFQNVKIQTLSNQPSGSGTAITYRITGSSRNPVDIQSLLGQFVTALQSTQITGVDITPLLSQLGEGETGDNSNMNGQMNINMNGGNSGSNNGGMIGGNSGTAGMIFTVQNQQATIDASTDAQLQQKLNQLLALWKTTLSQYQTNNLKINIVSKTPTTTASGQKGYIVVYTITGQSSQNVPTTTIPTQFQNNLQNAHYNWVTIVSSGSQNSGMIVPSGDTDILVPSDDMPMMSGDNNGNGGSSSNQMNINMNGGSSGSNNGGMIGGASGTAGMTFTVQNQQATIDASSDSQLQQKLNQILALWKTTLSQYQANNLKINVVSKTPTTTASGQKGYIVVYTITGQSTQNVPTTTIPTQFQNNLQNAHYNWVTIVSGGSSGMSNDTPDMGDISGNGGSSSGQMNVNVNGGSSGWANGPTQNTGNTAIRGDVNGKSFDFTQDILIQYNGDVQRNNYLQNQVIGFWKYATGQYNNANIKLVFVRAEPSPSSGSNFYRVVYRVSGKADQVLDKNTVLSTYNQAITNAGFPYIQPTTGGSTGSTTNWNANVNGNSNTGGNTVNRDVNVGGQPFTFQDSVVVSYNSQPQRDAYLQQLLALFKTSFAQESVSNLKITFVRETPASGGAKQVYYKITGSANNNLGGGSYVSQFQSAIQNANLNGISLPSASGSTSGTTGFDVNYIDDSIALTYTSNAQRDALLKQILAQWQTVLSQYGTSNLKISFVSAGNDVGNGAKVIKYRITGKSSTQFTYNDVVGAFQQAIQGAGISGVQLASDVQGSGSSSQAQASVSFPISITRNDLVLTYTSTQQRDSLLQQILALWRTAFSQVQSNNLQIKFVSEGANSAGGKTVTYTITGSAGAQFDQNTVIQAFLDALAASPINGVSLAGQASNNQASNSAPIVQVPESSVDVILGGGGGEFRIPGKLKLTYKTDAQRDTFVNQVLVMWRNSLWDYQVSNVQIQTAGVSGTGPTRTVSYVITGISALPIDVQKATQTFQQTLIDSHLTGIQYA